MEKKLNLYKKRLLGIDYGQKFTGLATFTPGSDPFVLLYGRLPYKSDEALAFNIQKIVEEEFIDLIVIGVPFLLDGKSTTMTKTVLSFVDALKPKLTIPLYTQDETLSSFEAKNYMLNSPKFNFKIDMDQIDAVAASIILEEFCNKHELKEKKTE